ncbi:MAG: divalent-cation tolerance protein CutA [Thermoplasmatota archaeon]
MAALIYSTTADKHEARKIARILVEEKLVACVTIIPQVESIYRWEGEIQDDNECILLAKTSDVNKQKAIEKIKNLQSYEVPDIVCFFIDAGYEKYLNWVDDETI